MSPRIKHRIRRQSGPALALVALAAGASRGWTQYTPPGATEPQWADLSLSQAYLKVDSEAEHETYGSKGGPQTKNQTVYVAPTLGLGFHGYVYHPDLLDYSLLAEPGFAWQQQGTPGSTMSQSYDYLANGNGSATILQAKPYATTFSFNRSHEIYDYDFFNSEVVDLQSWGVRTGYRECAVPFTVAFNQSHQNASGLTMDSAQDQTTVNAHARNERKKEDVTDLTYQFGQYAQTTSDGLTTYRDTSGFNYAMLTDTEHFRKSELNSSLTFNQYGASGSDSDSLNGSLDYSLALTPHLRNFYDYTFTEDTGGGANYQQHFVRAGLQHQLYESLNSSFDVHGAWSDSSSPDASQQSLTEGGTVNESYSKRLGTWGHLSLSGSVSYDRTGQSSSGSVLAIQNEAHTLTSGQWVPLGQPNVLAITGVTTSAALGNRPLTENTDYYVNRSVNPWLIEISPASIIITSGAGVLVTYEVAPNPSGDYSTVADQVQLRLDLFDNLVGLYARYDNTENSSSAADFVLENVSEFQAGTDFRWRGVRLSANYTDRQSSLNNYNSFSTAEGYTLLSSARDSAGIDFRQQWSSYPNSGGAGSTNQSQSATYYSYTVRYDFHPGGRFKWSSEAGYEQQRGYGLDENLIVARSSLTWRVGKLDMNLGYEYQEQTYTAEMRERNFFYLRMRRNF